MSRRKKLNDKQMKAIELLTCGKGLTYKEIAATVGVDVKQIWRWRHEPDFALFQEELERVNEQKWLAIIDAARASAKRLVDNDNQKMVEFVLKNAGYNPTQKVEADINTDIIINIEE